MSKTLYVEMREGEEWRDVADRFMEFCLTEKKVTNGGCHEGDPMPVKAGIRYAAISIPDHSAVLIDCLYEWAKITARAIFPPYLNPSMNTELEELYQSVILDHSRKPRNFGEIADGVQVHGDNPSCGDEIDLSVKFAADGSVEDVKFKGQGCAISQASASMMTMKLKGKSEADAREMLRAFHDVVTTEVAESPKMLGDLRLLAGVRKFPQRVKCAMLGWRAFEQALEDKSDGSVSTEEP